MPLLTTSGFILRKNHFKDADRVVVLFSKDFGKITALGKFAKKSIKRNLNLLDYGYVLKFFLTQSKNKQYFFINKVEFIEKLFDFNSFTSIMVVHYINEVLYNLIYSYEDSGKIFDFTINFLKHFNLKDLSKNISLLNFFNINILSLTGYGLNSGKCCVCGGNEYIQNYSLENLGFICNKCIKGSAFTLCNGTLKFLKNSGKLNFSNINLSQQIISEIEIIFFATLEKFVSINRINKIKQIYFNLKNGI